VKRRVHTAGPEDVATLGRLLRLLAEELGATLGAGEPAGGDRLGAFLAAEVTSPERCFLLAREEGRPVGLCGLRFTPCLWTLRSAAEVQELVVTADRRRRGCATALLEAAAAEAARRRCSHLWVLTESWNTDARAFYRRVGLKEKTSSYFEWALSQGGAGPPPALICPCP